MMRSGTILFEAKDGKYEPLGTNYFYSNIIPSAKNKAFLDGLQTILK